MDTNNAQFYRMNLRYFREKLKRLEYTSKEYKKTKEIIEMLVSNKRKYKRIRKQSQPLLRKKLRYSEDD